MSRFEQAISTTGTVGPHRTVQLIDAEQNWVRHPADLLGALTALLGIVLTLGLSLISTPATLALADDVREATASFLTALLYLPFNFINGFVTYLVPLGVWVALGLRKRWRNFWLSITAGITALILAIGGFWAIDLWWPELVLNEELQILRSAVNLKAFLTSIPTVAMVSAILLAAGTIRTSVTRKVGWSSLTLLIAISLIQERQGFTGAILILLLGIFVGLLVRWLGGTLPQRATGSKLIGLIRKAGIDVVELIRVDPLEPESLQTWEIYTSAPLGYTDDTIVTQLRKITTEEASPANTKQAATLLAQITAHTAKDGIKVVDNPQILSTYETACQRLNLSEAPLVSRNYLALDTVGNYYRIAIFDADRKVLGILSSWWERLKLKSVFRTNPHNLRQATSQMAFMLLQTRQLQVSSVELAGISHGAYSIALASKAQKQQTVLEVPTHQISTTQWQALWERLFTAHRQGLSHGNLHPQNIVLQDGELQIIGWEGGQPLASELSQKVDLAQMAALQAATCGIEKTLKVITHSLSFDKILLLTPFLQLSALPETTAQFFTAHKGQKLREFREALAQQIPATAHAQPVTLRRFSFKTIATVIIGIGIALTALGSLNFQEISAALRQASPLWMLIAILLGLSTYLGAGITLKAYTPERLSLRESTLIQVAASVVSVVAPAGIGPAALNLRYLQKRGVSLPAGVATVTVVQIAQFLTTVLLLLILSLGSGELTSFQLPTTTILLALAIVGAVGIILTVIPQIRRWIWQKIKAPMLQIGPRLVWLFTHPQRIAIGLVGSLIMTVGFVACFGAALKSLGYELPIITIALTFLLANSLGSALPSPGGIGPVEAALTGGLVIAGIPYTVAISAAILYRLFTFWGRIPLGWIALKIANKRNLI